jgi:pimeloyl-ACP methyl ester carboxylesterase
MLSRATATRWRPMSDEMLCASGWRRRSRRALGRCGRRAIVRAGVGRAWRTAAAVLAWRRPDLARELVVNEAGPLLASRHGLRVLALDAPGFGRSPPPLDPAFAYEERVLRYELAWREACAPSWDSLVTALRAKHRRWSAAVEEAGRALEGARRPGSSRCFAVGRCRCRARNGAGAPLDDAPVAGRGPYPRSCRCLR